MSNAQKNKLEYHLSVTRVTTQRDLEEDDIPCICCTVSMKRILATMLDLSVLKSPAFLFVSFSGLFSLLGLYTPFMFISERAKKHGLDDHTAYSLISTLGIANTLGRIATGMLSSIPNVKALFFSYISLFFCGLATIFSTLSYTYVWQFGFASVFGSTIACVAALRPIIIVDLLGLEKLTNGFGIALLFQGIACLIGLPLSAHLKNITHDYDASFYFAGSAIICSAVLLIPVEALSKWEKKRDAINDAQQTPPPKPKSSRK